MSPESKQHNKHFSSLLHILHFIDMFAKSFWIKHWRKDFEIGLSIVNQPQLRTLNFNLSSSKKHIIHTKAQGKFFLQKYKVQRKDKTFGTKQIMHTN